MTSQGKAALIAACLVFALLCSPVLAQVEEGPQTAQAALTQMREAADYDMPEARNTLVDDFGQDAVPLLVGAIPNIDPSESPAYLLNCIVALGELKAKEGTDVLLQQLKSSNMEVAYLAAEALGKIWEGQTSANDTVRRVNAELLALLYSDLPSVAAYGPGIALASINSIPVQRPENLQPPALIAEVDKWANANADRMPPTDQQPWQLNLRALLTTTDAATRQAAQQALLQKRALEAIDPAMDALAEGVSSDVQQAVVSVITQLSGVGFPPSAASNAPVDEQVAAWREEWINNLKRQTQQRYIDLAWSQLERALRLYMDSPSEESAKPVKDYRSVLVYQLGGADAIPADASPKARSLLEPALEAKKQIADAMAVLQGSPPAYEKQIQLRVIIDQASTEVGKEAGKQFLGDLVALARNEENEQVARQIGTALGLISTVPCSLSATTLDDRRQQLNDWVQSVRMTGQTIE